MVFTTVYAQVTSQKPSYSLGSTAPLRLPVFAAAAAPAPAGPASAGVWKLATSDLAGDDVDFIGNDGEDLLDDADIALTTTAPAGIGVFFF